jgi:SSS family solute:Na+ symporter
VAPLLMGQKSIFAYLQMMNGLYFIPIFAVVLVGVLSKRVPALAAKTALIFGFAAIAAGYFIPPLASWVAVIGEFHFLGIVFATLVLLMLAIGWLAPRDTPWQQEHSGDVDITPWRFAWPVGLALAAVVALIYVLLADPSVIFS